MALVAMQLAVLELFAQGRHVDLRALHAALDPLADPVDYFRRHAVVSSQVHDLEGLGLVQERCDVLDAGHAQAHVPHIKMHQVCVVLDERAEAAQYFSIPLAQRHLLIAFLDLLLRECCRLVLQDLVPADVEALEEAILLDDLQELHKDGRSQALPAHVELAQSV